jgi:hypothetical protein
VRKVDGKECISVSPFSPWRFGSERRPEAFGTAARLSSAADSVPVFSHLIENNRLLVVFERLPMKGASTHF